MANYFNVKEKISNDNLNFNKTTLHISFERKDRVELIKKYLENDYNVIGRFIVDTNHPNGDEIHTILSNGLIIIQNERTKKVVTYLIARPGQVVRYWEKLNLSIPNTREFKSLINLCKEHQENNWNNW